MSDFRYAQFCPVARATELLGSRWTLLIVRDLFGGPLRFSDLQARLPGISTSVLADRLGFLERHGVVERRELPPPAASSVYALTEAGRGLEPAVVELLRWGVRFMGSSRPDDHYEPAWAPLGLRAIARRGPSPGRRIALHLRSPAGAIPVVVEGGPEGTRVRRGEPDPARPADATLDVDPRAAVLLAAGALPLEQAEAQGLARAEGDRSALGDFPGLFEVPLPGSPTPAA